MEEEVKETPSQKSHPVKLLLMNCKISIGKLSKALSIKSPISKKLWRTESWDTLSIKSTFKQQQLHFVVFLEVYSPDSNKTCFEGGGS